MIPKVIHYCWFGRNPLPADAQKCIASWRKFLPDYEIKEWNEDNFDINICQYTREAYAARKYAFVSDYARFWILYHFGGLYFDTDVEVIRPMDHIVNAGAFMGIEKSLATSGVRSDIRKDIGTNPGLGLGLGVAPGLGLGIAPGLDLYREILDHYNTLSYATETGTVVTHTTNILRRHGFRDENVKQTIAGITIYPAEVFCPMDSTTGITTITPDTVSIHHYSCSWIDQKSLSFRLHLLKNRLIKLIGPRPVMWLASKFKR